MKGVFGLLGLVLVLAIVGYLVKQHSRVVLTPDPGTSNGAAPAAVPVPPQQLPQRVQQDVQRALEQGAQRASQAQ